MNQEHGFTSGQIMLAFLGGAAAGAVIALLTAPKRGSEVRHDIAEQLHKGRDRAKLLPEAVKNATEAAKGAFGTTLQQS